MSEYPSDWENGCIGDIAKVVSGYAFQGDDFHDNHQEGVPVVRMSDIQDQGLNLGSAKRISNINQEVLRKFQIRQGDLLFGMSGSIEKSAIVNSNQQALLNQRVGALRSIKENGNFHAHIFQSERVKSQIFDLAAGGAQLNISAKQVESIRIAIPPLPEQKKIAQILSGIDERIVTAQNQENYYSLLLESTLRDSFSHEADETKTLGEIAEFKSGRAFKSEELSEDGIKVTRISNLHKPNFPYWRYKGEYNPRIVATDGDILFSWAGVANSINVHRYKGENTLLNQHIYNFEFCDELFKEWTYWNLKTMLPKLRASIEGGAGQLHLTKGFIQSLHIPIIERSRMELLCNCFQSIEHLVEIQKIASTKAKALKTSISADLLSGRKRVSI